MTTDVIARIDDLELRLRAMNAELDELRALAAQHEPEQRQEPQPQPESPSPAPEPKPVWQPEYEPFRMPKLPRIELSELLGARSLAWAGGVVTVLGIVFFFVLAVDRGWVDHGTRVMLGAGTSAFVLGGGIYLRRRFGETFSSLAAVGAGIAGGYGTLLAATALYDLVPIAVAMALAAGIAAGGVAIALWWDAHLIAALGLVGALLVPIPLLLEDGPTAAGISFVAVVVAATAAVAILRRWRVIAALSLAGGAPQLLALAFDVNADAGWPEILLAAVFCVEYLVAGLIWHFRAGERAVDAVTGALLLSGATLAGACGFALFDQSAQGYVLLGVSVFYGAVGAVLFARPVFRDPASALIAASLTIAAVAGAELLSGRTLAIVWAAEAIALAVLSQRLGRRFLIAAYGYLVLAVGHAFVVDAPAGDLFSEGETSASGVASVLAAALAAAVLARVGRLRPYGADVLALVLATYGASLAIVAAFESFDWGHAAVTALWALVSTVALLAGRARGSDHLVSIGFAALAATFVKLLLHDVVTLGTQPRASALLIVGAAVLVAGYGYEALGRRLAALSRVAIAAVPLSLILLVLGSLQLAPEPRVEGGGLLAIALVHACLSVFAFARLRMADLAGLHGITALAVFVPASAQLLDGTWLTLSWAALSALLVAFATRERRLFLGATAFAALAAGHALAVVAPPADFFSANRHPGAGAGAIVVAAVATALLARARFRVHVPWSAAGLLVTYALSLGILELVQLVASGSVTTDFQRGHTAVSAVWGAFGLALLYAGLTRRRSLRFAGLALFAISLAKLFLYDLPSLSSITRALSFLAVGVLLLLGGLVYQRLSQRSEGTGSLR